MSLIFVILFAGIMWIGYVSNRIPKTGRATSTKGSRITATITNSNKYADRCVVMRAESNGKKYKVKMKPTEARPWIKGDSIEIHLVENSKEYRILFNDYFKANEERIRDMALETVKDPKKFYISTKILKYTEDDFELMKKSDLNSQRIFAFSTYMRMINLCTIMAVFFGVAALVWIKVASLKSMDIFAALVPLLIVAWSTYSTVSNCRLLLKKLRKSSEKQA